MDVVNPRCCGLDIHKKTVVACTIVPGADGRPRKEVRTFGTMTEDLLALGDWLEGLGVTHAALESTGVYWKPLYNLLEDRLSLLLVNAQHVKRVPGRKTDVKDSEWLADLLRHGLLRASFVPQRPQRELRELTRYRTSLVQERAREVNRLHKTLEGANIKLAAVASDVLGVSGRAMLEALAGGDTDPATLAALAKGRLRDKLPALERALAGQVGEHQRFLVARQLAHIDALEALLAEVSAEVARRLRQTLPPTPPAPPGGAPAPGPQPPRLEPDALQRLTTIPGVSRRAAEILLAEIGPQVGPFPTAAHLASWAGMCPGTQESAGKRSSGKPRQGSKWLRTLLVEVAQAASRTKDTALAARFGGLVKRLGYKKAVFALGHAILRIVYRLLADGTSYQERGPHSADSRAWQHAVHAGVRRLEALGLTVSVTPAITAG
jgi:transposase